MPFGLVCQNVLDTEQINASSVERVDRKYFFKDHHIPVYIYKYNSLKHKNNKKKF